MHGEGHAAQAIDDVLNICPLFPSVSWHTVIKRMERFRQGVQLADEYFERVETHVKEPLLMYFSSGTSGYPKMVLHNHTYSLAHLLTQSTGIMSIPKDCILP